MVLLAPRIFTDDAFLIEQDFGDEIVLVSEVEDENEDNLFKSPHDFIARYVKSIRRINGAVLGHLVSPDGSTFTDLTAFSSEEEAWNFMLSRHAPAFIWSIDSGETLEDLPVVSHYSFCEESAKAIQSFVQSVDGSRLEREGNFVYAVVTSQEEAEAELRSAQFTVVEEF